jgi:hypothetical protein
MTYAGSLLDSISAKNKEKNTMKLVSSSESDHMALVASGAGDIHPAISRLRGHLLPPERGGVARGLQHSRSI